MADHDPERRSADRDLERIAVRLADGEEIDWDAEQEQSPSIRPHLANLRWLEAVAIAARLWSRGHEGRGTGSPSEAPTVPGHRGIASLPDEEATIDDRDRPRRDRQPMDAPINLAPGDTWGHLTIGERIGAGGGGDVYRAHDPTLGREVALKVWRENAFYRSTGTEARRLERVKHPGILAVHGSARHDGLAGMWTDFHDGRNLEEVLDAAGPMTAQEAARIGAELSDALAAMHAAGMVHRDVKCSNVMLGAQGEVMLLDFGSVKELPRGVPESTQRLRGTPLATAPELFNGELVGPTADIYSLGVLLFRLVTGEYPVRARSLSELVDEHARRRPTVLASVHPDLDPAFCEVVDLALSPEPSTRPSARQMQQRLQAVAGDSTGGEGSGIAALLARVFRGKPRR